MYCYKCGKQIEDNSVICPYCGTALSQRPTQQTSEDPFGRPKNSSTTADTIRVTTPTTDMAESP